MRPQPYRPVLPATWWLRRPAYLRYMLRELTCVPIGAFAGLLTVGLFRLGQGPAAWEGFRAALARPDGIALLLIVLAASVYHSLTWFRLAPSTMPLYVGARKVPPVWIAAAHYLAWAAISLGVLLAAGD